MRSECIPTSSKHAPIGGPHMKSTAVMFAALLAAFAFPVGAKNTWLDAQGQPATESDSSRSIDGFSGMLIVTPDKDWAEKWNTPPETAPHFSTAKEVTNGNTLFMLTFFAGPGRDSTGRTDVRCDFSLLRPDGSKSIEQTDALCFQFELGEDPTSVFMAPAVIGFLAEGADQRGTWTFHMILKDKVRGVDLPLKASFVVR